MLCRKVPEDGNITMRISEELAPLSGVVHWNTGGRIRYQNPM